MERTLIRNYIYSGNYSAAEKICTKLSDDELEEILCSLLSESLNLCIFSFVQYMVEKTASSFWLKISYGMILCDFVFVEGMHSVGLHQARSELLKERSIGNLMDLLAFADGPESLISKDELEKTIQEIKCSEPIFDGHIYTGIDRKFDDELFGFLYQGFYEQTEKMLAGKSESEQKTQLLTSADTYESFVIYDFIRYMINKTKNIFWHKTAIEVLYLLKDKYPTIEGFENIIKYHINFLYGKNKS